MADQWWMNNRNNMRGYENINATGTQAWPGYNPNLFSNTGIGRFDIRNMIRPDNLTQDMGASTYQAPNINEEIVNENIHLDVNNNLPITPNVPRPGANWPGFGIPRAIAELGFRMKKGPYYSQKFPSREFTEGDRTYTQKSLGGYYHPDEVFNMQEFGGVGEGDPRKDKFGKNIVSFADDYEEGIEDWVNKYGKRHSTDPGFLKRRADKIAMWNKIQERRKGIEDANRAASNQNLARHGITHSGAGGGGNWVDPGGRDRGGQGAFRENISQMRGAARSYTDAQGNVGYSSGRKEGGRIGYNRGRVVNPGGYRGEPEIMEDDLSTIEFMQDQGVPFGEMASAPHPDEAWYGLWENLNEKGIVPIEIETLNDFKNWFHNQDMDMGQINEEGIASIV